MTTPGAEAKAAVDPGVGVRIRPLCRESLAAAAALLRATAQKFRDPLVGQSAEERLEEALARKEVVNVAMEPSGEVAGISFYDPQCGWEVYSAVSGSAAALVSGQGDYLISSDRSVFWTKGYLAFPGLLSSQAASIQNKMDQMMQDAPEATSDWNAVEAACAAFVLAVDECGKTIPGRILKVQAAALGCAAVLEVFRSALVVEKVKELYGFLGQAIPEHVDVFGTKFFPMWPGGVSVDWHQDCHYFGTASPRIISCGVYLEDTDEQNGCLRVVPGSHTFDFDHKPGSGLHAQGEWVTPDAASQIVDMVVPAGSVVLFNSRLLHAARRNDHATRTRYSLFGHFVPSDLDFSWRGTDFSHGVYPDRHQVY
mmetsp:Transcript_32905/g.73855  ORF Transcript_32905/g.73855 Transcript_32905/m.73855 type:complete len:368 (+) Transcript_32905:38-1141(+)